MTDTEKMLALARAVYPDMVWEANSHHVVAQCNGFCVIFNPADSRANNPNSDEQFADTLAWLLRNGARIHPGFVEWKCDFPHDGTPSGLRAAVTEAGMRVAG